MPVTTFVRADHVFMLRDFYLPAERFRLRGIHIKPAAPNGVTLTATNGHILGRFLDPDGFTDAPCTIELPDLAFKVLEDLSKYERATCFLGISKVDAVENLAVAALCQSATHHEKATREEVLKKLNALLGRDIIWCGAAELHDASKYPDTNRIIPKSIIPTSELPLFQFKYLTAFAKIAEHGSGSVAIIGNKSRGVALVDCGLADFFGLIMPIDNKVSCLIKTGDVYAPPAWAISPAPALAEAD